MIEAYLRANKLFVDYNEVINRFLPLNAFQKKKKFPSLELYVPVIVELVFTLLDLRLMACFNIQPQRKRIYSSYLELDLANVEPSVSGPKR